MTTNATIVGRHVHVFIGSGYQFCTILVRKGSRLPFEARSQRNGFRVYFSASVAKELRTTGKAINMTLI